MKKVILIVLSILLMFSMTACQFTDFESSEKIVAPNNNLPPILGKWKVEKYKRASTNGLSDEEVDNIVGSDALFHEKFVILGNDICLSPAYKIKNVNTLDYLLYQYKVNPDFLGIVDRQIQVIYMTSEEQCYYEFIRETDDKMIVNIDGVFFYLSKISDEIEEDSLNRYLDGYSNTNKLEGEGEEILRSGLLLGLKHYDDTKLEGNSRKYEYRTIWICSRNKVVDKVFETKDLFVPRKSGFWKVGVENIKTNGNIRDLIYGYPINKEAKIMPEEELLFNESDNSVIESINYIGNDYVSVETFELGEKSKDTLKVVPVDNIRSGSPIKISDIAGESGRNAFYEGANKFISTDHKFKNNYVDIKPNEESFGLDRRNGHWVLKGRINFSSNELNSYGDFNIKLIPPKELINYDELAISWNSVKLRVPQATDVYTSPNEDIAVIIAHNGILIYTIEGGELSKEPIKKIDLYPGEKVVMNEWATGKYIYTWEEEFLKNKVLEIK